MSRVFTCDPNAPEASAPVVLTPGAGGSQLNEALGCGRDAVRELLREAGAVLFRGFDVSSTDDFGAAVAAVSDNRLDYVYGSTPRTALSNRIFTASEYPPNREIPLHNENSFQRSWPLRVAFCCLECPQAGGETPIADMRAVTASVPAELLEKLARLGVKYVRNYYPYVDVPWQSVFKTQDRGAVAAYCDANDIAFEWGNSETLRTSQTCQGLARHPETDETVVFNQGHLFHVSSLGAEVREAMMSAFGEAGLPRNAYFGDGSAFSEAEILSLARAYATNARSFPWQKGDVMLLDNMRMAHGRRPFTGSRQVYAALLDRFEGA